MTMTLFYILNGLGLVFLLYVLANFWKEGHRLDIDGKNYASEFDRRDCADVFVATHPISHSAQGRDSVIPFRAPVRDSCKPEHGIPSYGESGMTASRISTR
jgi:hypothetical protein